VSDSKHEEPLREEDLDADPFRQFSTWYAEAGEAVRMPEAMAVATATPDGRPSVRMVLLKGHGEDGFVFFTNYDSRKGEELAANPRAALLFYWDPLGRQIRIDGAVERTTAEETLEYVRTRPRESRLSALASPQSRVVASREELEERVASLRQQYEDTDLPVTQNWGGFRVLPESFEFWQNRSDRLHDRFVYTPDPSGGWRIERLAP
jgi:pyridoxamine 5'-phosphate oxidase